MAFGNWYSSWRSGLQTVAIGLMVILAGVNFYVHLFAPYTIQSSITLINKHRQSLDYIEHEGYERFVFNLYHFKV